jgi:hypothetical protein
MNFRHIITLSDTQTSTLNIQIMNAAKKMAAGHFIIESSEFRRSDGYYTISITFLKDNVSYDLIPGMSELIQNLLDGKIK